MFGIDDMLMMTLIGGGLGAITNRKDPLKGALIGAGLGAGGAAIPGLLGAGGAASSAGAAAGTADAATTAAAGGANMGLLSSPTQSAMLAAQEPSGLLGTMGWKGATTGVQGALNNMSGLAEKAAGYTKPLGTALNAAQTVKSMMPQEQPFQMPPPPQLPVNKPDLSALLNYGQQQQQYDAQDELRKRALMQKYINGIGGGYGAA